MSDYKPMVMESIVEIRNAYVKAAVEPDGQGGAHVTIDEDMGSKYQHSCKGYVLGFQIPYSYPTAQVKDFYVVPQLVKLDGTNPTGNGFHANKTFNGQVATQVSRIQHNYDPDRDRSLVLKIDKVLRYIRAGAGN